MLESTGQRISLLYCMQGLERRDRHKVREVRTVRLDTLLTSALSLLVEAGVSALPVVDEARTQSIGGPCCVHERACACHPMLVFLVRKCTVIADLNPYGL